MIAHKTDVGLLVLHEGDVYKIGDVLDRGAVIIGIPLDLAAKGRAAGHPRELTAANCTPTAFDIAHYCKTGELRVKR